MITSEERSKRYEKWVNRLGEFKETDFVCFRCTSRFNNCNFKDRIKSKLILRIKVKGVGVRTIHTHCLPLLKHEQPELYNKITVIES